MSGKIHDIEYTMTIEELLSLIQISDADTVRVIMPEGDNRIQASFIAMKVDVAGWNVNPNLIVVNNGQFGFLVNKG